MNKARCIGMFLVRCILYDCNRTSFNYIIMRLILFNNTAIINAFNNISYIILYTPAFIIYDIFTELIGNIIMPPSSEFRFR